MIPAEVAFEQILKAIESPLAWAGFSRVEGNSHSEAFGSLYTTFGNGKEFIRLTWDGKERWFVLESIPANSVKFEYGWVDILLQFFRPLEKEAEDGWGDRGGYEEGPLCLPRGCGVARGGSLTSACSGRASSVLFIFNRPCAPLMPGVRRLVLKKNSTSSFQC